MSKHSEKFLRYFLPTFDSREKILIFSELQCLQTELPLEIKVINIYDEIFLNSIDDTILLKDVIAPIEDIFKTYIGEKEFIRVFLKYVHLETVRKIKNTDVIASIIKQTKDEKMFLLNKQYMKLDIIYRKWQLEQLEKEL